MGFESKWIGWIPRCVRYARVSILVNGSTGEEFQIECGLRQGCPSSSLLFNLVVEPLPIFVSQFEECQLLQGFRILGEKESTLVLQYAMIPFCSWKG